MEKAFKQALLNQKLTALYHNKRNTEMFIVCRILQLDENSVFAISFSSDASLDELLFFNIDIIYRIEQESLYLKKMNKANNLTVELDKTPWFSFLSTVQKHGNKCLTCNLKTGETIHGYPITFSNHGITLRSTQRGRRLDCLNINREAIEILASSL